MKNGDTVFCKKNYTYTGITPHKKFRFGESYVIQNILYNGSLIRIDDVLFNKIKTFKDNRNFEYYFEDYKEHRARKLRLLNINK